ncbi:MAG: ABC transporter ATP-binding protein [Clostridia bacterium]|nr:ABC transporter ATP-binding protein [Clostridia bacterium]
MNALEIKDLSITFSGFHLDNLNLTLPCGCIMGLIGENGAGKTTTIKLILNMLYRNGGTVTLFGQDNREDIHLLKEDIGVVMDEAGIPECLTADQVGKIMRHTFRRWDREEYARLLDQFALPHKKPFKDFSRGMKMKLSIAIAMSHHARLLLLDEPTGGLDPVVRDEVVEMFHDFTRDENHAILMSSHIVSDLEKLCDYVAFLHRGKLILCEEKDALLSAYGIVHCTPEQLGELELRAILHTKVTPYGVEAIVLREHIPNTFKISPISIEELFVFMVKEAK